MNMKYLSPILLILVLVCFTLGQKKSEKIESSGNFMETCLGKYNGCMDHFYCKITGCRSCQSKLQQCCNDHLDCESIEPKCSGKHCEIIDERYRQCLKDQIRCPLQSMNRE